MQGGKLEKAGKQAAITISMPNNFSDWIAAANEVKTELAAVGIAGDARRAAVRAVREGDPRR